MNQLQSSPNLSEIFSHTNLVYWESRGENHSTIISKDVAKAEKVAQSNLLGEMPAKTNLKNYYSRFIGQYSRLHIWLEKAELFKSY